MDKELFTICEHHLDSGLRGYPIGYCITSSVDPEKGVFYRGYPISDIFDKEVEEVIFLLEQGNLPSKGELMEFKKQLSFHSKIPHVVKKAIDDLPKVGHPMKTYAIAVLILGMHIGTGDLKKDLLNLQAMLPELTALVINGSLGWGKTPSSKPELGYVQNFCQMLQCATVKNRELFQLFINIFINLHMDHGGGNLSMFTAKAVASGHEDLFGSFAAALLALSGPRHGKANQDGLEFVAKIYKDLGAFPTNERVKGYVETLLEKKELIYGFGHAALRCEDPRATILFDFCKKHFLKDPLIDIATKLRVEVPSILMKNPKIQNPYCNIDSISGVALAALGFDFPNVFTVLFGLSRSIGIGRQIVYESLEAREGKGVPIYRPKYIYKKS